MPEDVEDIVLRVLQGWGAVMPASVIARLILDLKVLVKQREEMARQQGVRECRSSN